MQCQREVNLAALISDHPTYLAVPRILFVGKRFRSVRAPHSNYPKSGWEARDPLRRMSHHRRLEDPRQQNPLQSCANQLSPSRASLCRGLPRLSC